MKNRKARMLAADLCRRDDPDMDFEVTFRKKGTSNRAAVGCETHESYMRQAREILGVA